MPDLRTGGFGQRGGGFVADRGGFVAPGGGFAAAAPVAAGPDVLLSIAVTRASDSASNPTFVSQSSADRLQLQAIGTYSVSGPVDVTATATWSSGDALCATVSDAGGTKGQVAAVSAITGTGTTRGLARPAVITATIGAVSGNTTVSIDVDRDATSGKRVPTTDYQLGLLGYAGVFTSGRNFQEDGVTVGQTTLRDTIGAKPAVFTGTPNFQQTISGWARRFITLDGATTDKILHSTYGDSATNSILVIDISCLTSATQAAGSVQLTFGGNNDFSVTTGDAADELKDRYREGANIAECTNAKAVNVPGIRCVKHRIDGAGEAKLYTESEKLSPTYGAAAGTSLSYGAAAGSTSASVGYGWALEILGAGANQDDAWVKDLMYAFGWNPLFS
jgi:hypothetical protein